MIPRPLFLLVRPALLAVVLGSAFAAGDVRLRSGDLVAICGDSITEQKRYSVYLQDYLLMCQPVEHVDAAQFGWGGDVAWGFLSRMERNVLPFRPTVVTTCFGMNDGGYVTTVPERVERYRAALAEIVTRFKAAGVHDIVIGSPGAVDTGTFTRLSPEVYNQTLGVLRDTARDVAASEGVGFADVHGAMLEAMAKAKAKHGTGYQVAGGDGVHPGQNGHLVMAYAFLKALGFDGEIGTLTWDCASGAEASAGHRVVEASATKLEIESTRYPFCITEGEDERTGARRMLEFVPFNDELNRFVLVVKHAPAPQVKVTWGEWTQTFSAEELAKGVNLAAAFPNNPFSAAFARVEAAVKAQQAYETDAVKLLMNSVRTWDQLFPEESETVHRLQRVVIDRRTELGRVARAAVVPVRHTLALEAQ